MKKQNLYLIFHGRFPSEKAASLFAAKSCEAFADNNINVNIIVPKRSDTIKTDPYEYYNLRKNFNIVYLPTINVFKIPFLKSFAFHISFIAFSAACLVFLLIKAKKSDLIYSNETLPLFFAFFFFNRIIFEMHVFPEKKLRFYKFLFSRVYKFVSISKWQAEETRRKFKIGGENIICEPSAVDVDEFNIKISREEAREKLGLPADKKIILYTGHLYGWKGVDTLAEAADYLHHDTLVVFVGGTDFDIGRFEEKYGYNKKIMIAGFKLHKEMPLWLNAADIFVLPNTAKENISKFYTSPMKLFEYMSSCKPIVASDLPSIREILNERNSVLVEPDNSEELAKGIKKILQNRQLGDKISNQAFSDAREYTWDKRAKRIIDFVRK